MEERMYSERQMQRAWKRYRRLMRKQKLAGLGMLIISILSACIDGDITFAVFGVPFSLWIMSTSEYIG